MNVLNFHYFGVFDGLYNGQFLTCYYNSYFTKFLKMKWSEKLTKYNEEIMNNKETKYIFLIFQFCTKPPFRHLGAI